MLCPPLLLLARAWFPLPPLNPPPLAPELGRDDALRLPTWFLAVPPAGRVVGLVPAPPPPGRVPAPPAPGRFPAPPPGRLPGCWRALPPNLLAVPRSP